MNEHELTPELDEAGFIKWHRYVTHACRDCRTTAYYCNCPAAIHICPGCGATYRTVYDRAFGRYAVVPTDARG